MRFADLHLHTILSDGRRTPPEIIELASRHRLEIIAISDHDHVGAFDQALEAAIAHGITLIPATELSVAWRGTDVHLLAYAFDRNHPNLLERLAAFRDARDRRGERMVRKLQSLGLPITLERVLEIAGEGAFGRPHVGQALIEAGVCRDMDEAFERYLSPGRAGFVPKARFDLDEALTLIRDAGGVCSVAHPVFYPNHRSVVTELLERGVDGVEILHPEMPPELTRTYDELCVRMGKMRTGGSDDHGFEGRKTIGSVRVPSEWIEPILDRLPRV